MGRERLGVAVCTLRTVLVRDHSIDRVVHRRDVGRTQALQHPVDAHRIRLRRGEWRPVQPFLLRFMHPEPEPELSLVRIALQDPGREGRGMNPPA